MNIKKNIDLNNKLIKYKYLNINIKLYNKIKNMNINKFKLLYIIIKSGY